MSKAILRVTSVVLALTMVCGQANAQYYFKFDPEAIRIDIPDGRDGPVDVPPTVSGTPNGTGGVDLPALDPYNPSPIPSPVKFDDRGLPDGNEPIEVDQDLAKHAPRPQTNQSAGTASGKIIGRAIARGEARKAAAEAENARFNALRQRQAQMLGIANTAAIGQLYADARQSFERFEKTFRDAEAKASQAHGATKQALESSSTGAGSPAFADLSNALSGMLDVHNATARALVGEHMASMGEASKAQSKPPRLPPASVDEALRSSMPSPTRSLDERLSTTADYQRAAFANAIQAGGYQAERNSLLNLSGRAVRAADEAYKRGDKTQGDALRRDADALLDDVFDYDHVAGADTPGRRALEQAAKGKTALAAALPSHAKNTVTHVGSPEWHRLQDAWNAHDAAQTAIEQGGGYEPERRTALDLSGVMLDLADGMYGAADVEGGDSLVSGARAFIDLATDFIPGVSLAKDLTTLVTGVNPITGETVSGLGMGLAVLGVLTPGSLKGTFKGALKVAQGLKGIVKRGAASAKTTKSLVKQTQEAITVAEKFGKPVDQAFRLPEVQRVATTWGTSSGGFNQLLEHSVGKYDFPKRLSSLEEMFSAPVGSMTDFLNAPTVENCTRAMLEMDRCAMKVISQGTVKVRGDKTWYWMASPIDPKRGAAVIERYGTKQTLMPMRAQDWAKK